MAVFYALLRIMFSRLQKKWKVGPLQLLLILCTFAIGGSLTGFLGKKIMNSIPVSQDWLWAIIYIILITILWPLSVLVVSFFFGQYRFFSRYIRKMGEKLGFIKEAKKLPVKIAVFASGKGSNAAVLIEHFNHPHTTKDFKSPEIFVAMVVSNNPDAGVVSLAQKENIPTLIVDKNSFRDAAFLSAELKKNHIDYIVLAGFLWQVPVFLINDYPERILNIHPALLPKFGGKGMYGRFVHEAVIAAGETESGISIHVVNEEYDNGKLIYQASCTVEKTDTPESLAKKVQELEHTHFPVVVERYILETAAI